METLITILSTVGLAVFGWAAHLSSRVTVLETQRDDLETLIETRFGEVNRRLERIENAVTGDND